MVNYSSAVSEFIEVGGLETGVYFVRIYNETSSFTYKVLKK